MTHFSYLQLSGFQYKIPRTNRRITIKMVLKQANRGRHKGKQYPFAKRKKYVSIIGHCLYFYPIRKFVVTRPMASK